MARAPAVAVSVVVHAALVGLCALAVWCRAAPVRRSEPIRVVMVDLPIPQPTTDAPRSDAGGNSPAAPSRPAPPVPKPRAVHRAPKPRPATEPDAPPPSPATETETEAPKPNPATATETETAAETAAETGTGDGFGHGTGGGIGDGTGPGPGPRPRIASAPRPSLARPARLIYPRRTGEDRAGRTYRVTLTVDADGFVVGARMLAGGPSGRRAERASDAVWRFRYDPARDVRGRKIRSTVDQPFILLD